MAYHSWLPEISLKAKPFVKTTAWLWAKPLTLNMCLAKYTKGEMSAHELTSRFPALVSKLTAIKKGVTELQLQLNAFAMFPTKPKRRGIYLYGKASTAKSTIA